MRFTVTFEREVIERATFFVEADDDAVAKQMAQKIMTEDDWQREEINMLDVIAQRSRKS
jgi:hypothetical protein